MTRQRYFMESEEESIRLDIKTDPRTVQKYARWAGIQAGMKVGDFGCGPGKTSHYLNRMVQPGGSDLGDRYLSAADLTTPGVSFSIPRVGFCHRRYSGNRSKRHGPFDFIWVRFVLGDDRSSGFEIVRHILFRPEAGGGPLSDRPGSINCLSH